MGNLEQSDAWDEILRLKDTLPMRELARRFRTSPGAISAALRRAGAVNGPSGVDEVDDLPPEPGEQGRGAFGSFSAHGHGSIVPEVAAALSQIRPGSKDSLIAQHAHALGSLPDAEVARRAGVSIRTIASFRARHGIPGYRGPRRAQRVRPGREVDNTPAERGARGVNGPGQFAGGAEEPTRGHGGGTVERGAAERGADERANPAAGILSRGRPVDPRVAPTTTRDLNTRDQRMRASADQGRDRDDAGARGSHDELVRRAWQVIWRDAAGEHRAVLLAPSLTEAAEAAERAAVSGEIVGLALVGVVLDA
jgi:hypothetical protein